MHSAHHKHLHALLVEPRVVPAREVTFSPSDVVDAGPITCWKAHKTPVWELSLLGAVIPSPKMAACVTSTSTDASEKAGGPEGLTSLPVALAVRIFEFLGAKDLAQLSYTGTLFKLLAMDEVLWELVYRRRHRSAVGDKTPIGGWRQACVTKRREMEYTRALTYGRLGRVSSLPQQVIKHSFYEVTPTGSAAIAPTTPQSPSTVVIMSNESARELRVLRQGTCTWSALGPAVEPAATS